MADLRRDFTEGRMNLDVDVRLLPPGEYREAENIQIINSSGANIGAIRRSRSFKKLTNFNFAAGAVCLLGINDEARNRVFWFVKDSVGCYLCEYDKRNDVSSFVLKDTRPLSDRVLNLHEDFLITGIGIIINENPDKDLLLWTDNNMEPCCINISRAKTYPANGFEREDIFLIKRPPEIAPVLFPLNINSLTNNLEERFLSFSYRYKFLDGEYSALSGFTNYSFSPKPFDMDYYTLENKGMVNTYNALRISFNTGDKRVTDIQLCVKESNSNTLYIIETFNKSDKGWNDNTTQNFVFSNNKIYQALPERELNRNCDYVPKKAKALTIIENIPVFGNYTEGHDMVDSNGNKVSMNYNLELVSEPIINGDDYDKELSLNTIKFLNPTDYELVSGKVLTVQIFLSIEGTDVYSGDFSFLLENDYTSLDQLLSSAEYSTLINIISEDIRNNFQFSVPSTWSVSTQPTFSYTLIGGLPAFQISNVVYTDSTDSSIHSKQFLFLLNTSLGVTLFGNSSTLKTNRDYEIGVVYEDDFLRQSTVLTCDTNTINIPQSQSIFKNKIKVTLNNNPPAWAKRLRFVLKTTDLQYQNVFVNRFYNEDGYVWCKLEGDNKDKVKEGDDLIVKKGPNVISQPLRVKVLEVKSQEKDFITGKTDTQGNEIIEPAGLYMKIRPNGFSMDFDDFKILQNEFGDRGSSGFPVWYLDLFSEDTGSSINELAIPAGSNINLFINSSRNFDRGWVNATFDKEFFAQRDYATIEEWFEDVIIGKNFFVTDSFGDNRLYGPNLSLVRGEIQNAGIGGQAFVENPAGKLFLRIQGLYSGGTRGRRGYTRAKIVVRTSSGFYCFETLPRTVEKNIFFQNDQVFDIVNGNHTGNIQDQDTSVFTPAVFDLNFFNCYAQGNGVESYRIKDSFNGRFLNIDLRPSRTLIEDYKEVVRFADMVHGGPYVEATNTNRINEFNYSLGFFKQLDKNYGSIQKMISRDTNIVVLQQEKASYILFNKVSLFNADGSSNISLTDTTLGDQETYAGENGIGNNPESAVMSDFRIYYANPIRGIMQRLSVDGVEDIVYGMKDFFRKIFIDRPNTKILSGYDVFNKQLLVSFGQNAPFNFTSECGGIFTKYEQSQPFSYTFLLNNELGSIVISYAITSGSATITAVHDGVTNVASNVNGAGSITINRTSADVDASTVFVTITPVTPSVSYTLTNNCPVGINSKVVRIVLGDPSNEGSTITNRFRWGSSSVYSYSDLFGSGQVSVFDTITGKEGSGPIPLRNQIINVQSFEDVSDAVDFNQSECNRIGYLVSDVVYSQSDINTILPLVTWLSVSIVNPNLAEGNFLFSKSNDNEILYLLWDYRDRKPQLSDDSVTLEQGATLSFPVLGNDSVSTPFSITIETDVQYGTLTLNVDNTFTYTHDGSGSLSDFFEYKVTKDGCSSIATVNITIYETGTPPTLFSFNSGRRTGALFNCSGIGTLLAVYLDVEPFSSNDWFNNVNSIKLDSVGTTNAPAGWYCDEFLQGPDGIYYLYWDGLSVTTRGLCP